MSWIIWVVWLIIVIGLLVGAYRGALRIMVSVVTLALTIGITFFATPYVAEIIMEKTPVDDSIRDYVVSSMADAADSLINVEEKTTGLTEERVLKVLKAAGVSEEELEEQDISVKDIVEGNVDKEVLERLGVSSKILVGERENEEIVEELLEKTEIPRDVQIQAIEKAELPEIFKNLLKENNNSEIYNELGAETFAQYVGMYLAKLMIHIAAFLGVFLIVTIILRAIIFALNIVNDIPVLGVVNRLAGSALGLVCALMVIWFLFVTVTLFYTTGIGRQIYDIILGNDYMRIIYENNPLFDISIKI